MLKPPHHLGFSVNRGSAAAAGDGPDEPEPAD